MQRPLSTPLSRSRPPRGVAVLDSGPSDFDLVSGLSAHDPLRSLRGRWETPKMRWMGLQIANGRRRVLLAILAVAVLINAAFVLLPRGEVSQFVLEPLNANGTLGGDRPSTPLPIFDGNVWSVGGKSVGRLTDYLLDTDEWQVPHTFGKVMLIELPDEAGNEIFRRSIASLAEHGICQVAVFQKAAPVAEQGLASAVRVRQYRDASGRSRECVDRVNGET